MANNGRSEYVPTNNTIAEAMGITPTQNSKCLTDISKCTKVGNGCEKVAC